LATNKRPELDIVSANFNSQTIGLIATRRQGDYILQAMSPTNTATRQITHDFYSAAKRNNSGEPEDWIPYGELNELSVPFRVDSFNNDISTAPLCGTSSRSAVIDFQSQENRAFF